MIRAYELSDEDFECVMFMTFQELRNCPTEPLFKAVRNTIRRKTLTENTDRAPLKEAGHATVHFLQFFLRIKRFMKSKNGNDDGVRGIVCSQMNENIYECNRDFKKEGGSTEAKIDSDFLDLFIDCSNLKFTQAWCGK